ncbi:MAG: DegT/DnrJ/EryC1/StrS family aminotransferase [Campylobacterales bacterium]|nr:DegT/DnrJ/EryC1/StrS family aminotransferase [Campylobacterales bacterium]
MNNTDTQPLYVSSPLLPKLEDLHQYLDQIWESGHVTNNGPMNIRLEEELRKYLNVPTALTFNNGTIALLVALKMFDLKPSSEVITTPMTFAATTHAISWNGLTPVFADVLEKDLTIDPAAVEKAITPNTSAILATHVYGSICDYKALEAIAKKHDLKLIFDAAHAFGATIDGLPVGGLGDASIFSFHATKLFNTLEGGALTTPKVEDTELVYLLRNFGIKNEEEVTMVGINGKINEVQAAIGLLNLGLVQEEKEKRAELREAYNGILKNLPGITVQPMPKNVESSEQYYPIVIDKEKFGRSRDEIYEELKNEKIFARKYFHPICTDFEPYKDYKIVSVHNTPYVEKVKHEVLCLPFHGNVKKEHIEKIEKIVKAIL